MNEVWSERSNARPSGVAQPTHPRGPCTVARVHVTKVHQANNTHQNTYVYISAAGLEFPALMELKMAPRHNYHNSG
jgi:hypothetical protein